MSTFASRLDHISQRMSFFWFQVGDSNQFDERDCLLASKTFKVNCLVCNILFGTFTCNLLTSDSILDHLFKLSEVDLLLRDLLRCELEQEFQSVICVDLHYGLLLESCIHKLEGDWEFVLFHSCIH